MRDGVCRGKDPVKRDSLFLVLTEDRENGVGMRLSVRPWISVVCVLVLWGGVHPALAQEKEPESEGAAPKEWVPEDFTVGMVIHPAIARLPQPEMFPEIIATPMAITARHEAAQEHVLQGMAYIQSGWDYEAYRHFCEAARADPECLMAYWGIGLALATPNNEFIENRVAAVNRMLDLLKMGKGDAARAAVCIELDRVVFRKSRRFNTVV